jgi:hypothetical protein
MTLFIDMKQRYHLTDNNQIEPRDHFMNLVETSPHVGRHLNEYSVQNMDALIWNYKTDKSLWLELKLKNAMPGFSQTACLNHFSKSLCNDPKFAGVFVVQRDGTGSMEDRIQMYQLVEHRWKLMMNRASGSFYYTYDDVFQWIRKQTI